MIYISKLSDDLIDQPECKALCKLILWGQNMISVHGLYFFKTVYAATDWIKCLDWYTYFCDHWCY
jgi:hypothetical protein